MIPATRARASILQLKRIIVAELLTVLPLPALEAMAASAVAAAAAAALERDWSVGDETALLPWSTAEGCITARRPWNSGQHRINSSFSRTGLQSVEVALAVMTVTIVTVTPPTVLVLVPFPVARFNALGSAMAHTDQQ